jgi:hypothetical protein
LLHPGTLGLVIPQLGRTTMKQHTRSTVEKTRIDHNVAPSMPRVTTKA